MSKPQQCPKCQSTNIVDILYGLVHFRGEIPANIVYAGCEKQADSPLWACLDCKHRFPEPIVEPKTSIADYSNKLI